MGTEALIATSIMLSAATTAMAMASRPKPPEIEEPPGPPEAGEVEDQARLKAQEDRRRRAQFGRESTFKTSPMGLKGPAPTTKKTLLGQ